jgi:flagellar biosynthesis protein FlhG
MSRDPFTPTEPADQASGLRRLFAPSRCRVLAVAANPFVPAPQALLQTLAAAAVLQGQRVLVVDAASTAPAPQETALFGLAAAVERLHARVGYLAARGLPLEHVDARGSAAGFIDAACDADPQAGLLVLHADPGDLARILGRRALRPLLLGADQPKSITQAYASAKLLAQRCGLMSFDLLLAVEDGNPRAPLIVERLSSCVDNFLGALGLRHAVVAARCDPRAAIDPALQQLVAAQLAADPAAQPPVAAVPPAALRLAARRERATPFKRMASAEAPRHSF